MYSSFLGFLFVRLLVTRVNVVMSVALLPALVTLWSRFYADGFQLHLSTQMSPLKAAFPRPPLLT